MFCDTLKNCNDFFKTRPPAVIFFISLVVITITTFTLSLYIRYANNVLNTDLEQNWKSLTQHLNNLDLYFADEKIVKPYIEEISLVTLISVNPSDFKNFTKVKAYYKLSDWQPFCYNNHNKNALITVDFLVTNETQVCARIKGPKQYLPEKLSQSCDPSNNQDYNTSLLYSHPNFNSNESPVKLTFDKNAKFEAYLSQSDRNLIYVHLVWCSYILMMFVLVVLFYAKFYRYEAIDTDVDHFKLQIK
ncbi:hypothetical protein TcasGA2_TC033409 [Tribolium castaneum]|uniref:TMEM248/TMEM219 domain-containing protein n=1 Tax=Tribolium castaneum TaxID=7070 RepID=A0A139WG53_TRICA|nr:PREDICTED: uncharacterized protein LOC103313400 [Tribolium castaneum]KYB26970.1 hypothetical protein TcasGA2_TC033409 [Tribolium castaneum]|eukprot:XP_008194781.1 PREDICTED: uncharacterized protein LOC103313400 [Tribolium castaneum]